MTGSITLFPCDTRLLLLLVSHNRKEDTMPRKPSFARYLRDARIKRGLSVAELADEVGVSGPCVYFWEMGRARPQETRI